MTEATGDRVTWTYDPTYQLTHEQRSGVNSYNVTYTYDPAGNRTLKNDSGALTTSTYDKANRLTYAQDSTGRTTFTFDATGNQSKQLSPTLDITTSVWDFENMNTSVLLPDTTRVTLVYNGDKMRVEKDATSGTARFVYDGQNILLETDGSNLTQAVYTLEPKEFGNLISQRQLQSGTWVPIYYAFDGLGSTDSLTDASQVITDTYTYFAFGVIKASTGTTTNRFAWVGQLLYVRDSETGEFQLHVRQLLPDRGRFKSNDPLGYVPDENPLRYVKNDPINAIDPSGTDDTARFDIEKRISTEFVTISNAETPGLNGAVAVVYDKEAGIFVWSVDGQLYSVRYSQLVLAVRRDELKELWRDLGPWYKKHGKPFGVDIQQAEPASVPMTPADKTEPVTNNKFRNLEDKIYVGDNAGPWLPARADYVRGKKDESGQIKLYQVKRGVFGDTEADYIGDYRLGSGVVYRNGDPQNLDLVLDAASGLRANHPEDADDWDAFFEPTAEIDEQTISSYYELPAASGGYVRVNAASAAPLVIILFSDIVESALIKYVGGPVGGKVVGFLIEKASGAIKVVFKKGAKETARKLTDKEVSDTIKSWVKLAKKDSDDALKLLISAAQGTGKGAEQAKKALIKLLPTGFDVTNGFSTFDAFKNAWGRAGNKRAWHHVVEQTINSGKFSAELLHNPGNLINLPHGEGSIHAKISGYYSSTTEEFTHGLRVRDWLSSKPFKEQFDFGIDTIKKFGGAKYLPPELR